MIHIESHSPEFHSIRFYGEEIRTNILTDLPEYIGVGHLKIFEEQGFISAVCFKDENTFTKHHRIKLHKSLKDMGCSIVTYNRHKNNQIRKVSITL